MENKQVGSLIKRLRIEKGMTQRQVAETLKVTEQAVSKWERGLGLPDISSLNELCKCLGVNTRDLLNGRLEENKTGEGKLKNLKFYVCPLCLNILFSSAEADISCCSRSLTRLSPKKAGVAEEMTVEKVESEWYITGNHPMAKDNYILFSAYVTDGGVSIFSHYPEWNYELRLPRAFKARLFWYSEKGGLFWQEL